MGCQTIFDVMREDFTENGLYRTIMQFENEYQIIWSKAHDKHSPSESQYGPTVTMMFPIIESSLAEVLKNADKFSDSASKALVELTKPIKEEKW